MSSVLNKGDFDISFFYIWSVVSFLFLFWFNGVESMLTLMDFMFSAVCTTHISSLVLVAVNRNQNTAET